MINRTRPFNYMMAEGRLEGITPFRRFGRNNDIPATYETIWCNSSLYVYMSSANRLLISSSSAQDDVGGTGTLTLQLKGLDANYDLLTETITMKGAVPVQTAGSFLRLFTAKSITAGTAGINVGNITITDSTGVITVGYLEAGEGKTHNAFWTVPNGKTAIILDIGVGEMAQKKSDFGLFVRPFGKSWHIAKLQIVKNQTLNELLDVPLKFDEKTDIEIRAKAADGSGIVVADFSGYYL